MDKRKKQHYVPEFYLKEWCIPSTEQVNVYDKIKHESRPTNISKIAAENYFYDFNLDGLFDKDVIHELNTKGIAADGKLQLIERMFSTNLEGPLSSIFAGIIHKTMEATPWTIKECFFISDEEKEKISVYLAFQFVRVKSIRTNIKTIADKLTEFAVKMGASEEAIEQISLSKAEASKIHNQMMLDEEHILKTAALFHRLTWVLGINRTNYKFYTSDNPICLRGHNKAYNSSMLGIGLASLGIEVFFPLSPDLILIMVDGDYHSHMLKYERRYAILNKKENIDYYNSIMISQAERFIISCNGDFALIDK